MRNPYEVLGLEQGASLDDVKKAYRELARIHNNDYQKMDELNAAYDTIVMNFGNKNRSNTYANTNAQYTYEANTTEGTSEFGDIRAKLNGGRIDDAEMLLDGIPHQRRGGEWYFLKGTIQQRRGWLESAAESFKKACETEPGNSEYANAYNNIKSARNGDFRREREADKDGCCDSPCKICSGLICADCCCECCGGDLIRCC